MDSTSKGRCGQNHQKKKGLPTLTGRQIAHMIHASFEIHDVQSRAIGLNDVLNTELRNDSLQVFDCAWVETLMAWRKNLKRIS